MRGLWLVAALLGAGCYDPQIPAGAPCSESGACPMGLACEHGVCLVPGTGGPDASADAAPEPDAVPACVARCEASQVVCGDDVEECALGCTTDGGPRCRKLVPSNGVGWELAGDAQLVIDRRYDVDTGTGEIRTPGSAGAVVLRAAGPGVISGIYFGVQSGLAVFGVAGLALTEDGELRVRGPNPVVFLVDGDVVVGGLIDASGGCPGDHRCAGPGGGSGANRNTAAGGVGAGGSGGVGDNGHGHGGGGGGFGQAGARAAASANVGGGTYGNATLVPLRGGSGGGYGGTAQDGGDGGGGGGGLQITAAHTLAVLAKGAIDAGGGGGQGERVYNTGGGGGGGSGGGILLEGFAVVVLGTVTANGGGAGGHTVEDGGNPDGADALRSAMPAPGEAGAWGGGNGGTGAIAPTRGRQADDHGGGGGGGAGRVRLNGLTVTTTGGVVSGVSTTGTIQAQ